MTIQEFRDSIGGDDPPAGLTRALEALWHDAGGDWEKAHQVAQGESRREGAWVHAYLHRKEGDLSNASYWYSRAEREKSNLSLDAEWDEIAEELLKQLNS